MFLNELNPSLDEIIALNPRVLLGGGDIWKDDQDGCPHRHISMYGDLVTVKVPASIPLKSRGRKLRRLTVRCNACELVTRIEAHYGSHVVLYIAQENGALVEAVSYSV